MVREEISRGMVVVPADLRQVLLHCGCRDGQLDGKNQVAYLSHYLTAVGARTAVIERGYIDKDFLEDFARYYSRCFRGYPRICNRIHFFSVELTAEAVEQYILDGISPADVDLPSSYLGFVVVRPLPNTIIGRTCLVPYANDSERHYNALRHVRASFFGRDLNVRAMPFQEQDSAVAACATCALWSALSVTSALFAHPAYTPIGITEMSTDHGMSISRRTPNRGLCLVDVVYAIRRAGLVPECLDARNMGEGQKRSMILGAVYAYLRLGLPVMLMGKRYAGRDVAGHAVVINGYHFKVESDEVNGVAPKSLCAEYIDKLYVHDDQLGPYARAVVGEKDRLDFELPNDSGLLEKYSLEPEYLIVPIYHKIRVRYEEVWGHAYGLHKFLKGLVDVIGPIELSWDITLCSVSEWKEAVRNDKKIGKSEKLCLLTRSLPKYLWSIKALCKGECEASFAVDATDSGQGLKVVVLLCYSQVVPSVVKAFYGAVPELALNPLAVACCGENGL